MKIRSEILAIISSGEFDGPNFRITAGMLDRKVYQEVAKAIEAAGGKWNKRAKALVFDGDAAEALEPLLLTGEVTRTKQEFGQFDTPDDVAKFVADFARIGSGTRVLEPNCGVGNLVLAAERLGAIVTGVEVDSKRQLRAIQRCKLHGGCHLGDFLDTRGWAAVVPTFDVALMNPPFAGQADIDHVLRAADVVRRAGGRRVVAIMSAGVNFRRDRKTVLFQEFVADRGGDIVPLPDGSFKPSGTDVNTVVVAFDV